jgi:NADH:ubiquinone reductase (non-electrogenic)
MTASPKRICILGGGFGGLYTALRLSNLPWPQQEPVEIVLIDQRDRFLFAPLLYELVTGELQTWEICPTLRGAIGKHHRSLHSECCECVNLGDRRCCCRIKSPSPMIASSSRLVAIPPWVASWGGDHAIPFRTVEMPSAFRIVCDYWKLLTQKLFGWR